MQCLPRQTLKSYLDGSTSDEQSRTIEDHLSSCSECERTIVELESDPDTFVDLMRGNDAQSDKLHVDEGEPSVVRRAIDTAKSLAFVRPHDAPPTLGFGLQHIGAYQLLRPLGRGGMGTVYLALHKELNKQFAVKVLPSVFGQRPELVGRFLREIRAVGRLSHPSIACATDAGQTHGIHYLVMEYISGLDLSRLARAIGELSIQDACEVARQVAIGLSHAHAAGLVHRDVKPSNLMLDESGRIKILDFGLAHLSLWEESAAELTTVGQLMGTLDYMAPEQAERSGSVDYRADLYSLGATLFRLLCGRAPLAAAPSMSLLEKVRMLADQTAPRLSLLRNDAPEELVKLVGQLLSRQPNDRPASALHVAQAIEPFCSQADLTGLVTRAQSVVGNSSGPSPASEPLMLNVVNAESPATVSPQANARAWFTGRAIRWIAAGLIPLAIAAGILVTLQLQSGQLVIQSDVADVQVRIARDGQIVRELTIDRGAQTTRLRADKYEITIESPSDVISLDTNSFTIKNGQTVVATIKKQAAEPAVGTVSVAVNDDSNPLSYGSETLAGMNPVSKQKRFKGISLNEWLDKLQYETHPKERTDAVTALVNLINKQNTDMIGPVVLNDLRSSRVADPSVLDVLQKAYPKPAYHEMIVREMKERDEEFAASIFNCHVENEYLDSIHESLVAHAIALVTSQSPASEPLVQAAGRYLLIVLGKGIDSSLESKVMAALKSSSSLSQKFWTSKHSIYALERQLSELRSAAAARAFEDLSNPPEISAWATILLARSEIQIPELSKYIDLRLDLLLNDWNRATSMVTVAGLEPFTGSEFEELVPKLPKPVHLLNPSLNGGMGGMTPPPPTNELLELFDLMVNEQLVEKHQFRIKQFVSRLSSKTRAVDLRKFIRDDASLQLSWPELKLNSISSNQFDPQPTDISAYDNAPRIVQLESVILFYAIALVIESPNNKEPPPKNSASRLPEQAPSLFNGKVLDAWIEIYQRDKDMAARGSALKAIATLADKQNATQLIARLLEVARSGSANEWSKAGRIITLTKASPSERRHPISPSASLDEQLWSCLVSLTDEAQFVDLFEEQLASDDLEWNKRWMAVVFELNALPNRMIDWLLNSDNVDRLDREGALLLREVLLQAVFGSEDVAQVYTPGVIAIIRNHPQLGLPQVLNPNALAIDRFRRAAWLPGELVYEAAVAEVAQAALSLFTSTPEELALAACRLSSGPDTPESWRSNIVAGLRHHMKVILKDPSRISKLLPGEFVLSPAERFTLSRMSILPSLNVFSRSLTPSGRPANNPFRQQDRLPERRYVGSEPMAYLALITRMDLASELQNELAGLLQKTEASLFEIRAATNVSSSNGVTDLRASTRPTWPFAPESMSTFPAKIESIKQTAWIESTINDHASSILYACGKLTPENEDVWAQQMSKLDLRLFDQNNDNRLSREEASFVIREAIDVNNDQNFDLAELVTRSKNQRAASLAARSTAPK